MRRASSLLSNLAAERRGVTSYPAPSDKVNQTADTRSSSRRQQPRYWSADLTCAKRRCLVAADAADARRIVAEARSFASRAYLCVTEAATSTVQGAGSGAHSGT
jgi:hypothetical protein